MNNLELTTYLFNKYDRKHFVHVIFMLSFSILLLSLTYNVYAKTAPLQPIKHVKSITAPQWSLKTQSNDEISLAQLKGKPVVLHFWATWCPYCKKVQPALEALQSKYANEGIELIGISFNEDKNTKPQDVLTQRGHSFITAVNGEKVAYQYGVRGTPTTFFINRKGEVLYKTSTSSANDPKLEIAVKEIIKKE